MEPPQNCSNFAVLSAPGTPAVRASGLAFTVLFWVFALVCLVAWTREKPKYARTRVRPSSLVVMAALGLVLLTVSTQLFVYEVCYNLFLYLFIREKSYESHHKVTLMWFLT
jgi:hypothetical protein